jgi:hypothetical protein
MEEAAQEFEDELSMQQRQEVGWALKVLFISQNLVVPSVWVGCPKDALSCTVLLARLLFCIVQDMDDVPIKI